MQKTIVRNALKSIIKNASKQNENTVNMFFNVVGLFKKHLANYVRFLNPEYKKLSDEEAITILNDDILLNTSGTVMSILRTKMEKEGLVPESNSSVIKSIEKDYSFDKAKSVYSDACKFVMTTLAKEHNEHSFYELKYNGDEKALEAYTGFTEWKIGVVSYIQ